MPTSDELTSARLSATITINTEPATHQATCASCGWHTVPMRNRKRAEHLGRQHERVCPSPPPPRMGARTSCGCWNLAMPGRRVGAPLDCPVHGATVVEQVNISAPRPDPGGQWIPVEENQ